MKGRQRHRQLALFPAERGVPEHAKDYGVQVRLEAMQLHRPRQWGACWLACQLYEQLELDRFWADRLPDSREGTSLAAYPADAGVLSADRSRQRMAAAPAMVRAERDGGSSRRGLLAGGEECTVSLLGQAAGAQGGAVQSSAPALAGSFRSRVRCPAVRPDEHLFRVRSAGR